MAAVSTSFAAATGCAVVASTHGDAWRLSSGNAFRTTSSVQLAPVSSTRRSNGFVAARAALPEDSQKAARREVLVSILGAGAALSFAGNAFAIGEKEAAKKAEELGSGLQKTGGDAISDAKGLLDKALGSAPSLPKAPKFDGLPSVELEFKESAESKVPAIKSNVDDAKNAAGGAGGVLQ